MLPHIHTKSREDLFHLAIVGLLMFGIGVGVYLSLEPQLFEKRASVESKIGLQFIPESMVVEVGKEYEIKIAISPKSERVSAVQLNINYDPAVIAVLEVENEGFLPVALKESDDHQGNLTLIYGSTIESRTESPGMLSSIRFRVLSPLSSAFEIKPTSEVSVSSVEGNVLTVFPRFDIEPQGLGSSGEVKYPGNLLLEKVFFASSGPAVRDFKEILEPKPEIKPERVEPGFSVAFLKQLGTDIFISPIAALNHVLEEKAGEILGR